MVPTNGVLWPPINRANRQIFEQAPPVVRTHIHILILSRTSLAYSRKARVYYSKKSGKTNLLNFQKDAGSQERLISCKYDQHTMLNRFE